MSATERLLTPAEVERAIGFGDGRGRKLVRLIRKREQKLGVQILHVRSGPQRRRYRVAMAALRSHLPELFRERGSQVDGLDAAMREFLDDIDDRIANGIVKHHEAHVEPRLTELWERDEKIARNVIELTKRVRDLSGAA